MKKKKGFTLIELLAVIVILAIILLIAMISANKIINKSKLEANLISAQTLVKAIKEDLVLNDNIKSEGFAYYSTNNDMFKNLIDGQYPDGGAIVMYNNTLIQANLCYKDQSISYDFDGEVYKKYNDDDFCNYSYYESDEIKYVSSFDLDEKTKLYGKSYKPEKVKEIAQVLYKKSKKNKFPSKDEIEEAIREAKNGDTTKANYIIKNYYANNVDYFPDFYLKHSSDKLEDLMDNSAKLDGKISQMANISQVADIPKKYVLTLNGESEKIKEAAYIEKDQDDSGLCWAFANTSQIQNSYAIDNDEVVSFSERHLDYFTAANAISSLKNPYSNKYNMGASVERKLGDGGSAEHSLKSFFSGLTLQTSKKFGDKYSYFNDNVSDWQVSKASSKEVFDVNNLEYYVKNGNILTLYNDNNYNQNTGNFSITDSKLKLYQNILRSIIMNYGGTTVILDAKKFNDATFYDNELAIVMDSFDSLTNDSGLHAVTLIGWDDDLNYNGKEGYWIARNSSKLAPVILIPYDSKLLYVANSFFYNVTKKDFDNSYNSYNFNDKRSANYYGINYFKKVSNKNEKITGFSYLADAQENTREFYIIDAANIADCKEYNKVWQTNYNHNHYNYDSKYNFIVGDEEDLNVYDSKKNVIGAVARFSSPASLGVGYNVLDDGSIGDHIFKNNYCVLGKTPVTIFTKNYNKTSANRNNIDAELVSKKEISKEHAIDVAVNNNISDSYKVDIVVKDSSGADVTSKCEIEDTKLINNVAHVYVKLPNEKKYKVYAKYNGVTSNEVVLNENSTQVSSTTSTQTSTQKSNNKIECSISKKPEIIYANSTNIFYLNCMSTDAETKLVTKSLSADKIDVGLFANVYIDVENGGDCLGSTATIICPFKLKTNKFLLFNHNIKIKIKKNAIVDEYGLGNDEVSRSLSVNRKRK